MKVWFKKNKQLSLLLLLTLLLGAVGVYLLTHINSRNKGTEKKEYLIESGISKSDIHLLGDSKQYVLIPSKGIVSKKYIITQEMKVIDDLQEGLQEKGEYWNLILYNLEEEGLSERKIDLYQVVREYDKNSIPIVSPVSTAVGPLGSYYIGAAHYLQIEIKTFYKNGDFDVKDVYLNVETEKIEDLPEKTVFAKDSDVISSERGTTFLDSLANKGYTLDNNDISKLLKEVPDPNINLYSLYPELQSKLIDKGWTLYVRPDKVTPDEWFDTLLHWFAAKGEDVLPVYGRNDDLTASDTQIRNSQEAKAWLEQHPKLQEN